MWWYGDGSTSSQEIMEIISIYIFTSGFHPYKKTWAKSWDPQNVEDTREIFYLYWSNSFNFLSWYNNGSDGKFSKKNILTNLHIWTFFYCIWESKREKNYELFLSLYIKSATKKCVKMAFLEDRFVWREFEVVFLWHRCLIGLNLGGLKCRKKNSAGNFEERRIVSAKNFICRHFVL